MRIDDFLRLLQPQRKHQQGGEWKCRCPAHDDKQESLSVSLGKNQRGSQIILCKCFAGCGLDDILRALRLTKKDLVVDPDQTDAPPWDESNVHLAQPVNVTKPAPKPKENHGQKHEEAAYSYTDEDGTLLYQSVRYRYDDGSKTFRQRRPDPEHPGQWLHNMDGVRLVLYRLPDVLQAIREKQPVFVAEGEKDADNLAMIGLTGTTSPMGAGKWNKGDYAESLRGAVVYALPDNDDPGWNHARDIARSLEGKAEHCKILDLRRVWPELPKKGDVSDLIARFGSEEAKKKLLALAADNSVQYADLPLLYAGIRGYTVFDGRICQQNEKGINPLCNFLALPTEILTLDDGVTAQKWMKIRGWTASGKELPPARVPVEKFPAMSWVTETWDIAANLSPGSTIKDKLRYALSEAGRSVVTRRTEYIHTGWRKIGGNWAFLHGGGALGADNVKTALEGSLTRYNLDSDVKAKEGFSSSWGLLNVMSRKVAVPLLAAMYLAPLRTFLSAVGIPPGFALFLAGRGGTRKTTAAALALSHFGDFNAKTPTASFHDTANSVRRKAFCLQDLPLLIDDYHPSSSQQERRRMEQTAQELARAFGDNADRSRMSADRTLQTAQPPRCLAVMTGEDLPQIGESGLARYVIVRMDKNDVPVTDELTKLQDAAAAGALRGAMRGYIRYLLAIVDELPGKLKELFRQNREEAKKRLPQGGHMRSAEALAHLMTGWQMLLLYGYNLDQLTEEQVNAEQEAAWSVLIQAGEAQAREAKEEAPENAFLSAISELLSSGQCWAIVLDDPNDKSRAIGQGMIGWRDINYYYLLPDLAFRAVSEMATRQGVVFPLSKRALMRALKESGKSETDGSGVTKQKRIMNKNQRVLWIPRHILDGGDPPQDQTSLPGFTQVGNEDLPF